MQAIHLDLSRKGVVLALFFKQGDVGRKFEAEITDNAEVYDLTGVVFSVWYSGTSGEGNYTAINGKSAFSVTGNKVTVEVIAQMLVNRGGGALCLVMSDGNGKRIGLWNIPYIVEPVPGADSAGASQYYTAFSEAVKNLPYPDTTLSVANKAADAASVGAALAQKAPAGYGLGADGRVVTDCNLATANGWYITAGATNSPPSSNYGWIHVSGRYGTMVTQDYYTSTSPVTHWKRYCNGGTWGGWECENPPMAIGTEYRTTERWNGKAVYVALVSLGNLPNTTSKSVSVPGDKVATNIVRFNAIATLSGKFAYDMMRLSGLSKFEIRYGTDSNLYMTMYTSEDMSAYSGTCQIWYTKD